MTRAFASSRSTRTACTSAARSATSQVFSLERRCTSHPPTSSASGATSTPKWATTGASRRLRTLASVAAARPIRDGRRNARRRGEVVESRSEGSVGTASLTAERARLADEAQRLRQELDRRTTALDRSEARFRDVIERNADAIVVVDGDGLIRFTNAMATKLFGGTRAQLVGSPFGFPLVADETTELDLLSDGAPRVAEMRVVQSEWE